MSEIILGKNQYGKAENRVVRIYRDSSRHEIHDINVSTCLRGDFSAAHLAGGQAEVLPTEDYSLALARHFFHDVDPVRGARVEIDEYGWERAIVDGSDHDHTWIRRGQEVRTAAITVDAEGEWVVGGLKELIILKSTGSEFAGFLTDEYTVLAPTHDPVMATSLVAQWRFAESAGGWPSDWNAIYSGVKSQLVKQFATVQSLALQQTLFQMGKAVLEAYPVIAEVRLSAPNKHHFAYDLSPFGLENNNEVFNADDRPYGLIQASVLRDDSAPAGPAWTTYQGWLD